MQQPNISKPSSSKPVVIEVGGEPQGVVVPAEEGFRFLAVKFPVFGIDGQTFSSIEEAQVAAADAIDSGEEIDP